MQLPELKTKTGKRTVTLSQPVLFRHERSRRSAKQLRG